MMVMKLIVPLLLGLTACVCGADLQVTADPPLPAPDLLLNGNLEAGEGDQPTGWRFGTAVPENFTVDWVTPGRSGKCLHLRAASGIMSGYWNQTVKVQPATDYLLTGWFRLNGGKLLCYVHGGAPDGRSLDERFYVASMRNHFLVPIFLKPEYMAGIPSDAWQPVRIPFRTGEGMEAVAVSLGLYFTAGEAWFDDLRVCRAKTDLRVSARGQVGELVRVRVLASGEEQPLLDAAIPATASTYEKTLPAVPTDRQYTVEATTRDKTVVRKLCPDEVAR